MNEITSHDTSLDVSDLDVSDLEVSDLDVSDLDVSDDAGTTATDSITVRREFWAHAGVLYGLPVSDAQLDEVSSALDDVAVVERLFPQLVDVERQELLWALGAHLDATVAYEPCAA
jgi:hypothetical protein